MTAFTKSEIVDSIARDTGLPKAQIDAVLQGLAKCVAGALAAGSEVRLPKLGTLHPKHRAASKGRNPRTGAPLDIAAKTTVGFRPAVDLRGALQ